MNDTPTRTGVLHIWGGPLLVLSLFALAVLPTMTPFVGPVLKKGLMTAFATVCHQLPDRSPHWFGTVWAICHRDAGIYFGLPAGAGLYLLAGTDWLQRVFRRPPAEFIRKRIPLIFAISLVPMMFDWGLDAMGLLENTPETRIVTGAIFGITGGFLVAFSLLETSAPR